MSGDPSAARAVRVALEERGIGVDPGSGCDALRVSVTHRNGALRVERLEHSAGLGPRVVATVQTAALLIESWLRTDIAAPLLVGSAEGFDEATPERVPSSPIVPVAQVATVETLEWSPPSPDAARSSPRAAIALIGEAGLDRRGWRAYGLGVVSCVNLGPVCAGVAGHLARISVIGNADVMGEVGGYAADALFTAELPWRWNGGTLRPGAAVGAGWVGVQGDMNEVRADVLGLRAEARVAVDWRLSSTLAIELAVAGGLAGSTSVHEQEDLPGGRERLFLDRRLVPIVRAGMGVRFGGNL